MSNYRDALTAAMAKLATDPRTLFIGQSVRFGGQAMFPTLAGVPIDRRIEMPVAEDFQMGFCIGLALQGFLPVCIYPRWDFLLLAANQLVNHLDKLPFMGDFRPKVIIRTGVGPRRPLDAGPQHTQDHTAAFRLMLRTVEILEITTAADARPCYEQALRSDSSVLVVERLKLYRPSPREEEIAARAMEINDDRGPIEVA